MCTCSSLHVLQFSNNRTYRTPKPYTFHTHSYSYFCPWNFPGHISDSTQTAECSLLVKRQENNLFLFFLPETDRDVHVSEKNLYISYRNLCTWSIMLVSLSFFLHPVKLNDLTYQTWWSQRRKYFQHFPRD